MRDRWKNLDTKEKKMDFIRWNVCVECENPKGECNDVIGSKGQLKKCVELAEKNPDKFFNDKLGHLG